MPVHIADANGYAYWSTVAQGICWAADHGARVVNVSYKGVLGSSTVQTAAQYLRSKGGVVVAAGNSGGLKSIAASDAMLPVAATEQNDVRASFSSYGPYVDLSALGVSLDTTTVGGGYAYASGTSFSSPLVAATAALTMSANNKLPPADVGRLLRERALMGGLTGPRRQHYLAHRGVSGVVPVDVNYSDNVGVTRVDSYVNGQLAATDSLASFAFAWDTASKVDGSSACRPMMRRATAARLPPSRAL